MNRQAPPPKSYWLPRTIRPTREGWWLISATLVVGLAATNTGNNLLYLILAMMLSFTVISGVLSEQALRRVHLRRGMPDRLFAGTPATFSVGLTNGKRRLPSYALYVAEPDPGGRTTPMRFFLKVGPQACEGWTYSLMFPRRGRQPLPGLRLFTRFPFGLFTKSSRPLQNQQVLVYPLVRPLARHEVPAALEPGWRERHRRGRQRLPGLRLFTRFPFGLFTKSSRPIQTQPVLVYPAVRPLARAEVPAALESGWRERHLRGRGAGLYNLRQYRPGDDPRLLHWKTSARTGDLVLREHEAEERPQVRMILEDPAPGAAAEAVEKDLSYAASVAAYAIRRGAAVELVTGDGVLPFDTGEAHLDRVLEWLAVYAPPAAPRLVRSLGTAAREVRMRLGAGREAEGGT